MTDDGAARKIDLVPSRDDLVDAGFLATLTLLALVGFRTTFSGEGYLLVGALGLVFGLLIAHLATRLRQPMIAVLAITLVVFFLLGGAVALHSTAVAGVLPSGATFRGLADQSVHGWKDLLTTLPPVDGSGPLLVLPYILGLLGGVIGLSLARRTQWAFAPVFAPVLVLVMVILLGAATAPARIAQGALFGVVAIGWAAARTQRARGAIQNGHGRPTRYVTVAVLLGLAGAASALLGPHVPGTNSHQRLVLRQYVQPPFDIGQYPSPLSAFRRYAIAHQDLNDQKLFTVTGLPTGTPIRIATLDDYDGLTWRASDNPDDDGSSDVFQRVGTEIDNPAQGHTASYVLTVDQGYDDVWLPDTGALQSLAFHGADASSLADYFRYDLGTGTGIVPQKISTGDSYSATTVLPNDPVLSRTDVVASGPVLEAGAFAHSQAEDWAGSASTQTAQIFAVASHLRTQGRFSNGEAPFSFILPGQYRQRLANFLTVDQLTGDDEQYAATFALLINQLGVPARVVLGAVPRSTEHGVVRGRDVHAWVEVELADGSWRAIMTQTFLGTQKPQKQQQNQQQPNAGKVIPPPTRGRPRSTLDDAAAASSHSSTKRTHRPAPNRTASGGIPGWVLTAGRWVGSPLLLLAVMALLIVALKAERRRRRRTRGSPATRLARAWHEVLDHSRDLGGQPGVGTRRDQARELPQHDISGLARAVDAYLFGPQEPAEQDADVYWREVDAARRRMSSTVGRARRVRAALSLSTLRPRHLPASGGAT